MLLFMDFFPASLYWHGSRNKKNLKDRRMRIRRSEYTKKILSIRIRSLNCQQVVHWIMMWVPVSQHEKSASWKIPRLYRMYTPKINWKSEWEAASSLFFWHFFFKVRLAFCLFQFFFALWVSVSVSFPRNS